MSLLLLQAEAREAAIMRPASSTVRAWGRTTVLFGSAGTCRLCGVGAGVTVAGDGTVYVHADPSLQDGLCRSCARSAAYRRAHKMRRDRPDPPIRGTHRVAA